MAVFVDTYNSSNSTDIGWKFPSFVDPLFLTLIILLSLPGILLNPIVIKSRITRISNSIPALLTTCLCGVYLVLGVLVSIRWTYLIVKDTPNQDLFYRNSTAFDQVYSFFYYSSNIYSTALLYLMAFSRYRAIADPFDAVPYKKILRRVIGFGIATVVVCLAGFNFTADPSVGLKTIKFYQVIIYQVTYEHGLSWYDYIVPHIFPALVKAPLSVSSLIYTWRTIKLLRNADDTPAETREQRRNSAKMVLVLVGGQILEEILNEMKKNFSKDLYFAVTECCLFQCFQASYTAVALLVMDKEIKSEVRKMLGVLKRPNNAIGTTNEGDAVVTAIETALE
eukprot:sb/3466524/